MWLCRGALLTVESTWRGRSCLSMQWGPVENRYLSSLKDCCTGVVLQHVRAWAHALFLSVFCGFFTLSSLTAHFLWLGVHLIIFNWIHLSGDTEVEPVSWQLWESHIAGWDTKAFCQEAACICANTGLEDSRTEIEPQALQGIGSYSLP